MWAVGTKKMESNEKPSACVRPTLTRLPHHRSLLRKTLVQYATCDPLAHSRTVVIPAGMTYILSTRDEPDKAFAELAFYAARIELPPKVHCGN